MVELNERKSCSEEQEPHVSEHTLQLSRLGIADNVALACTPAADGPLYDRVWVV